MKVLVSCAVEKVRLTDFTYTHRHELFEVDVIRLRREPCGTGAASKRYTYRAVFHAPKGVLGISDELITGEVIAANINRAENPKWKPPKTGWEGNAWQPKAEVSGVRHA